MSCKIKDNISKFAIQNVGILLDLNFMILMYLKKTIKNQFFKNIYLP